MVEELLNNSLPIKIFYIIIYKTMRTQIFDTKTSLVCYIDRKDFEKDIKNGVLKIEKEFPNEDIKLCSNGVEYYLMDKEDWIIEVSSKEKCWGQSHKYQIHSNIGWFPDEPITIDYKQAFRGWNGQWRYKRIRIKGIDFEENGGSMNMYSNSKNGKWRRKMEEAGFKVINKD